MKEKNSYHICLYFASTLPYEFLIEKYQKYKKHFCYLKDKKHITQGKTTRRRKGTVEMELAIYRHAVIKLSKMIYLKKNIMLKKIVQPLPSNFTYEKSLYKFLKNI